MEYFADNYDVAVIGAGHAGIEAGLAAARLGCKTAVFTINLDWIGNMPCNPSIGGTSKGHLVREIDALGGEMGKAADKYTLQSRMLNLGKGPAVHSLRAQIDRREYSKGMKHTLEKQENLDVRQAEIVDLTQQGDGTWRLVTKLEAVYAAKCVVIATGTFLGGRVYIGDVSYSSGPDGMFPANELSAALYKLNIPLRRFKTGTPSRVNRRSVDFSKTEVQEGDSTTVPFSFETKDAPQNKVCCYITYTNEDTKKVILENLDRSPLYSGKIEGKGPRYCPSFEDKVVRFSDKERHQLFIEPCGLETEEMYLQGLSSSLPEDVQLAFIHTIPGLEHVQVMRTAYAIEYDCVDPTALKASLEFNDYPGLFGAGQFNGSSGYEEAAAQGLIAGINAVAALDGTDGLILGRDEAYIGVMIDDLVTKGTNEPYRLLTSRAEYRLLLRHDNADVRLTGYGHERGLISEERYQRFLQKQQAIETGMQMVKDVRFTPKSAVNEYLQALGYEPLKEGISAFELLRRPKVTIAGLQPYADLSIDAKAARQIEIEIKYEGYIAKARRDARHLRAMDQMRIPKGMDYATIEHLSLEARQKLAQIQPMTLGQASRISGVNPADLAVLAMVIKQR